MFPTLHKKAMKHHRSKRRNKGFALVGTLAVLVVVTILVVAYSSTMRTERAASENFAEYDRAQAIAHGMLNRILADHATPQLSTEVLEPYEEYYNDTKALPDPNSPYIAPRNVDDARKIFIMEPTPGIKTDADDWNGLVRISKNANPGGGSGTSNEVRAYDPEYWSYVRVDEDLEAKGGMDPLYPSEVPDFVDYYDVNPTTGKLAEYPSGQVAFTIWDDGGKIDINMLGGPDPSLNGFAPYHLDLEKHQDLKSIGGSLIDDPKGLAKYLDGEDPGTKTRDRSNFSLRRIATDSSNNTGNDRWFFSIEELVKKDIIAPDKVPLFTTWSRDFDVRPEWHGDRAVKPSDPTRPDKLPSTDFLRSYLNNPALFDLFLGNGNVGPNLLVTNEIDNSILEKRLMSNASKLKPVPKKGQSSYDDWMQVMRLLSILRRSLPPYIATGAAVAQSDGQIPNINNWSNHDIWGIALNILQASAPISDHNLFAYDPIANSPAGTPGGNAYKDPNLRLGIRISPYITECAIQIVKTASGYTFNDYVEVWNPYPFYFTTTGGANGTPFQYRVGEFTGSAWPSTSTGGNAIYGMKETPYNVTSGINGPKSIPPPGEFRVFKLTRNVSAKDVAAQPPGVAPGIELRMRPFLQNISYYSNDMYVRDANNTENGYYCVSMAAVYNSEMSSLWAWFSPQNGLPTKEGESKWYSFQIDDPRMGPIRRNNFNYPRTRGPSQDQVGAAIKYSWQGYFDKHTLAGMESDPNYDNDRGKTFNGRSGYNANFGDNWPGGITSGDNEKFAKMMATFALPGRPLNNIGELGSVFANRPWRTLNFANSITPAAAEDSPPVSPNSDAAKRPAAFLDYFTTLGTTTNHTNLFYRRPGSTATANSVASRSESVVPRTQDKNWLFDKVTGNKPNQVPGGNLRPIRGRINLNTASKRVLAALLKPAYRLPASLGLQQSGAFVGTAKAADPNNPMSDLLVQIQPDDAEMLAEAIAETSDAKAIRPLRTLSDLSRLYDKNQSVMRALYEKYPETVIDAMMGRLAQFGTIRQQIYTVDIVARALNPRREKERVENPDAKLPREASAEVRMRARVYFDTFSRKSFIESVEYR
jgi:type II secretory pathway pseudopilin PulG